MSDRVKEMLVIWKPRHEDSKSRKRRMLLEVFGASSDNRALESCAVLQLTNRCKTAVICKPTKEDSKTRKTKNHLVFLLQELFPNLMFPQTGNANRLRMTFSFTIQP